MSETPDNPSAHASLCFYPTLALTQPPLAESEPVTPPCTDAHAETPTQQKMGNQQSGEGSLRRRSKKKSKKDDKGKVGIASALFNDPVLGASSMGSYSGTPVDDAATPNKRKRQAEQTKSPRPIRSTYDNVNQSGSITSLCDASEMYTSDLFLDTVSRLDVSMTPSQAEIAGIRHHIDPQTIDNLSYGGSSLAESGFITPALATPQVQRNQLAGAMTTSDSVTELGKEIERTIFERLSASQKAGNTEAQPEVSVPSSPKSNEVKMTLVMESPIPPRKAVTEVKLSGASPRTAKLEIIDSNQENSNRDPDCTEPKPLKPLVESRIEIDLGSDQPVLEENGRKPEVNDGTDKSDNELMEKQYKPDDMKQVLLEKNNSDDAPEKRVETKEKHEALDVNLTSSSSDENCGDFENVKLHIEEEDLLVTKNQEEKKTPSSVKVEASEHQASVAGQVTMIADKNSNLNPEPSVASAGQQSTLVKQDVPEPENVSEEVVVVGEQDVQREPTDKEEKTEKTRTSVGVRRRRERPKTETTKEENKEKTGEHQEKVEKLESVFTSQTPQSNNDEAKELASTGTAVAAAAAVVATEPLESTVRTVVMPIVSAKTDENVNADTPKAACEELIQATDFASVEQAQVIMRRPVFQHDDQGLSEITRTEEETKMRLESKSKPIVNLEPKMDDKNSEKKSKEELKELIKEKEQTSITPSEEKVPAQTDESLQKEQSLLEAKKAVASTSNPDDIPTTKNMEDTPKEKSADENPNGGVSEKTSKAKKDRKRKRKKGKQQPVDDATTTEAETKETSKCEDIPTSTNVDETLSSKEDTEKSTTDDSGDSSGTAFDKHSLQQQITIIERTGYKKDGNREKEEADDKPVDACDLFLQSEEFRNQEICKTETPESPCSHQKRENPVVSIETNLTVESPASSEILSDEPTPTNDRSNQLRAFYMPDRSQKSRVKLFCVADSEKVKDNESGNDMVDEGEQRDDIRQQSSDLELKPSGSPPTLEDKNNSENESIDNAVAEDSLEGTKTKTEQKRNLRISLTSEEVSEILQNSQTILDDEARSNSRPLSHNQETEDEVKNIMTGSDRKEDENDEEEMVDEGHRKKHAKNISNLTLSDIDSSLPETLPELADLQNFLEYIKVGEQPTEGETPPFSPRGETGRSSPNENSNSRRLSRISPAVTERSVTESDLDISEQRDDLSTDSNIFADDEDESSSELLFTKTYTEPDQGGEVCVSCTVVNTNADDDSDEFWAENSATEEVYRRIETSTKAVTTVFDNARLQMQDIHTHLHNLRLQMESLQESLDNASILSQEYYNMDNDQVTSQEFYSLEKGLLVSQEYFSRSRKAPVTTEEYSPVDIGPVLTEEYYSSTLGKPPLL